MRLKINTWTAIDDVINIIFAFCSWFLIIGAAFSDDGGSNASSMAGFLSIIAIIGLILNIIALVKSKEAGLSIAGQILGIIGNALFVLGAILALPTLVLLILACVFTLMQKPVNK